MIEEMKKRLPHIHLRQALLLAFIQAYGWFWLHVLFTNAGKYGSGSGDMGLVTLTLGWFWALIWGYIVCFPLARRLIGAASKVGYMYTSVLFPLALWILQLFEMSVGAHLPRLLGIPTQIPNIRKGYEALFQVLGFGILREGRPGYAHIHAWMFLAILVAGAIGFSRTIKTQSKTESKAL